MDGKCACTDDSFRSHNTQARHNFHNHKSKNTTLDPSQLLGRWLADLPASDQINTATVDRLQAPLFLGRERCHQHTHTHTQYNEIESRAARELATNESQSGWQYSLHHVLFFASVTHSFFPARWSIATSATVPDQFQTQTYPNFKEICL